MLNFFKRPTVGQITKEDPEKKTSREVKRVDKQVATINSPFNVQNIDLPYNPDDLYQKKQGYDIYYEMLKDDQIKALLETKKNTMIGAGWEIVSPTDVEGNEIPEFKEVTNFIKENFEDHYDGSVDEGFYAMLTAMEFGFSLSEQIYKIVDDKVVLSKLSQVPPDTLKFEQDEFGNITAIMQESRTGEKPLPIEKFVLYTWNMRDGNPYGNSDLRPAYIYWFSKLQVIKYRNIFLERHGFPIAVAKYNPNEEGQVTEVQNIVKSIQAATSVAIPESMELEYKQPKIGSADPFDTALRYYDKKISTALLLPDLLGFNDTKEGSLALGKQHFELFVSIVNRYRRIFEEVINEQIIRKLVDFNFPGVKKYPKIVFKPVLEQDHTEKVNTFVKVVEKAGYIPNEDDYKHIKQVLGFPSGDVKKLDLEKMKQTELDKDEEEKDSPVEPAEDKDDDKEDDKEKFVNKINHFLDKSRDKYIIGFLSGEHKDYDRIYCLANIKTYVYRALKISNINKYSSSSDLNRYCEEEAYRISGNISKNIIKDIRSCNFESDNGKNIVKINEIFNKYRVNAKKLEIMLKGN